MALDPKYRSVIYLHYYEGYSCRELAKLMGLSESQSECGQKEPEKYSERNLRRNKNEQGRYPAYV